MPRSVDTHSTFLRAAADVLVTEEALPFQELVRRAIATGRVVTVGKTPQNTLSSLLRRAQESGQMVDGRQFVTFKVGSRLWVRTQPRRAAGPDDPTSGSIAR